VRDADVRVTRLVSLAAQKIISQIVTDARICAQQRLEMQAKDKRERGFDPKDRRVVMTLEDLMAALTDYGLGIRKPAYFVGGVAE
jgi:transcription initiation factor TFIID subunit 10